MRNQFIIFPEGLQKLESHGLLKKIYSLLEKDSTRYYRHQAIFGHEIVSILWEMKNENYFSHISDDARKEFIRTIQEMANKYNIYKWEVQTPSGIVEKIVEPEDVIIFTGWHASCLLEQERLWNYNTFGFDSFSDLFATIGIYMLFHEMSSYNQDYEWESETTNNEKFKTVLTTGSDDHLIIQRANITSYKTTDPFGKNVSYRPFLEEDRSGLSLAPTGENHLLAAIIKYVDQEKISSEVLQNNAEEFINEQKKKPHFNASTSIDPSSVFFRYYDQAIPVIGEKQTTHHFITKKSGKWHGVYINDEKDLVFAAMKDDNTPKSTSLVIPKTEIDQLLKGMFSLSGKGLLCGGHKKLVDTLEYRFSEQFVRAE
jgi:hypothetical protein